MYFIIVHNPQHRRQGWMQKCCVAQGMLPPEAQDHERIRAHLNSALNAMNSAVEGVPVQYAQPAPSSAAAGGYGYTGAAGETIMRSQVGAESMLVERLPATIALDYSQCKGQGKGAGTRSKILV